MGKQGAIKAARKAMQAEARAAKAEGRPVVPVPPMPPSFSEALDRGLKERVAQEQQAARLKRQLAASREESRVLRDQLASAKQRIAELHQDVSLFLAPVEPPAEVPDETPAPWAVSP